MSLFNPWVLLAIGVAFLTSNAYSYVRGQVNKENAIKAAQAQAYVSRVKRDVTKANTTRAADVKGEAKTAATIQAKDLLAMEARHALELDIERKARERAERANPTCPVTSCDLDDRSYGLLIDTIRRANTGDRAPAGGKPDAPLPRDPESPGRRRGDGAKVVLRLDPALRRVP